MSYMGESELDFRPSSYGSSLVRQTTPPRLRPSVSDILDQVVRPGCGSGSNFSIGAVRLVRGQFGVRPKWWATAIRKLGCG